MAVMQDIAGGKDIDLKKPYILMTPDEKARADSFRSEMQKIGDAMIETSEEEN